MNNFSDNFTKKQEKGITGSTLKLIAIITMFIDHTAAVILNRILIQKGIENLDNSRIGANGLLVTVYSIMRLIGRLGFPIFCFLLVEGFIHTRNKWKYAVRLALFALISEIPFDLALNSKIFYFNYQNVFFTLLIGLLVIIGFHAIEEKLNNRNWPTFFANVAVLATGMFIADFLNTDYSAFGILTIAIMYTLRKDPFKSMLGGCITLTIMSFNEITAFFALFPIYKYNGKRGLNLKYIFYAFYPVHLLVLYMISYYMGIT